MPKHRLYLTAAALALWGLGTAGADTLTMPAGTVPEGSGEQRPIAMELPARGLSMAQVEKRFGPPKNKLAPVGEPPITRWVYDDYTVYFEYKYVIDAVLKRR